MLGLSSSRVFVYEVSGLRQNDQTTQNSYPVRNSSNLLFQVPYNRMNSEMRRLTRLGGKIVAIHPLSEYSATSASPGEPSPANEASE